MKKTVFAISMVTAIIFIIGIIWASDEKKITNTGRMGVVNVSLSQWYLNDAGEKTAEPEVITILPGRTVSMIPTVTNEGAACYIRSRLKVAVKENGEASDLKPPFGTEDLAGLSGDWTIAGDYIYYTKSVEYGASVELFRGFTVPKEIGNEYAGTDIVIEVEVDAVQREFFEPDFKSDSPWGDLDTETFTGSDYDFEKLRMRKEGEITVFYEGSAEGLMILPEDFFSVFSAMMPGGTYTASAEIKNKSSEAAELFFKTEVLEDQPLFDQLFLSIRQISRDGSIKVLYEGSCNSKALQEYNSLGVFEPGAEGTLQYAVSVPKDLKNIYALEEGKVNWYFKAADKNPKGLRTDAPGTGDTGRFVALLCAFSVSSFLLLILKKTVR